MTRGVKQKEHDTNVEKEQEEGKNGTDLEHLNDDDKEIGRCASF